MSADKSSYRNLIANVESGDAQGCQGRDRAIQGFGTLAKSSQPVLQLAGQRLGTKRFSNMKTEKEIVGIFIHTYEWMFSPLKEVWNSQGGPTWNKEEMCPKGKSADAKMPKGAAVT